MINQNPQQAMSEFENIQRLIRLKRFEQPGEGFTEDFLHEFHRRQRAEMLKRSSVELFLERASTWWSNLMLPKWSLAAAAVVVCAVGVWMFAGDTAAPSMAGAPAPAVVPEKPFIPKLDLSELPMANMAERGNSKLEESLIRKHLEMSPVLESGVSPLPASAQGFQQIPNSKPATRGTKGK